MVRWSVLRALNETILPVFPFVDLSEAYLCPLTAHPYAAAVDGHIGLRSSVGHAVCAVRRLIFLSSKKSILRLALDRTVTRAKKAEDDYDYPEDLSTVVLCRPKAVLAKFVMQTSLR